MSTLVNHRRRALDAHVLSAIGILFLAILLRLWALDTRSIWVDEAKLLQRTAEWHSAMLTEPYFNPPLIYLVFRVWARLGNGEVFLRLLPALAGAMTVLVVYDCGRQLLTRRAALLAAFLCAVSPFHIYYSQEINTYAFAVLFAALTVCFYVRLQHGERRSWIWVSYSLALLLGLYTHTYTVFLFVTLIVHSLIWGDERRPWLVVHGLILLGYLPWLMAVQAALLPGGSAGSWTELISPRLLTIDMALLTIAGTFYAYLLGMTVIPTLTALPLIVLTALAAAVCLGVGARQIRGSRDRVLLFLLVGLPLALTIVISMFLVPICSPETPRYLILFLPAFLLLLAGGIDGLRTPYRRIVLTVLVLVSGFSLYNYYYRYPAVGMGDFRSAVAHIRQQARPDDLVLHVSRASTTSTRKVSTLTVWPFRYYLGQELPQAVARTEEEFTTLRDSLSDRRRLWLVFVRDTSMWQAFIQQWRPVPLPALPAWTATLADCGFELTNTKVYPGRKHIAVYLYEREVISTCPPLSEEGRE